MTSLESSIRYSGHCGDKGSMKLCRRHARGGKWKLLLITISDGEKTGLSANPDTGKVKNREGVWALHDKGHGRQPSTHQKAGKHLKETGLC